MKKHKKEKAKKVLKQVDGEFSVLDNPTTEDKRTKRFVSAAARNASKKEMREILKEYL